MRGDEFLTKLAGQLASDLTGNNRIKEFTTNSALIGAYAEATVRTLIARVVYPLRVSRGAIVYEGNCPKNVSELDCIVWFPCPVPAVFEAGDFALVPRGSAVAYLEIKRSAYSGAGTKIAENLEKVDELVLRMGRSDVQTRAFGVVCLREAGQSAGGELNRLVKEGNVVILLDKKEGGEIVPNVHAVHKLVNFLQGVRARARVLDGTVGVNTDLINQRP